MKKILVFFLLLTEISFLHAQPEIIWQLLQDGSTVVWAYAGGDEFNDSELDCSKWNQCFDFGCDQNGDNGYFISGNSHHILEDGILKLATKYEPNNYEIWHWDQNGNFYTTMEPRQYTSGMIISKQKFKYGLFEIQFKLPEGKGLWPAFWLWAGDYSEEFDIFECKGEDPYKIHWDLHYPGEPSSLGGWVYLTGSLSTGFNNMMGEWGPNICFWYLNGHEFQYCFTNELDHQANIIINAGVAAPSSPEEFLPPPDNSTTLPAYFEIDFIRVWTRIDCDQTITISNYNQSAIDPTVVTGKNIYASSLYLAQNQYLDLIATNEISISPLSEIKGEFNAKIVDCQNSQKNMISTFGSYGTIETDSVNKSNLNINPDIQYSANNKNQSILFTKIFPNPSKGIIALEFEGAFKGNIKIEFFNANGQIVYSKDNISEKKINIDISYLPKGNYLLKGTFESSFVIEKIILN